MYGQQQTAQDNRQQVIQATQEQAAAYSATIGVQQQQQQHQATALQQAQAYQANAAAWQSYGQQQALQQQQATQQHQQQQQQWLTYQQQQQQATAAGAYGTTVANASAYGFQQPHTQQAVTSYATATGAQQVAGYPTATAQTQYGFQQPQAQQAVASYAGYAGAQQVAGYPTAPQQQTQATAGFGQVVQAYGTAAGLGMTNTYGQPQQQPQQQVSGPYQQQQQQIGRSYSATGVAAPASASLPLRPGRGGHHHHQQQTAATAQYGSVGATMAQTTGGYGGYQQQQQQQVQQPQQTQHQSTHLQTPHHPLPPNPITGLNSQIGIYGGSMSGQGQSGQPFRVNPPIHLGGGDQHGVNSPGGRRGGSSLRGGRGGGGGRNDSRSRNNDDRSLPSTPSSMGMSLGNGYGANVGGGGDGHGSYGGPPDDRYRSPRPGQPHHMDAGYNDRGYGGSRGGSSSSRGGRGGGSYGGGGRSGPPPPPPERYSDRGYRGGDRGGDMYGGRDRYDDRYGQEYRHGGGGGGSSGYRGRDCVEGFRRRGGGNYGPPMRGGPRGYEPRGPHYEKRPYEPERGGDRGYGGPQKRRKTDEFEYRGRGGHNVPGDRPPRGETSVHDGVESYYKKSFTEDPWADLINKAGPEAREQLGGKKSDASGKASANADGVVISSNAGGEAGTSDSVTGAGNEDVTMTSAAHENTANGGYDLVVEESENVGGEIDGINADGGGMAEENANLEPKQIGEFGLDTHIEVDAAQEKMEDAIADSDFDGIVDTDAVLDNGIGATEGLTDF
ncbi:hypothetical protein HDU76_009609 [Blyttiomyces sp. JEL0837]|nr:hypothetical protein HDU76_009609 [Blyttiomyces sp. JEL0837]